MTAATYLVGWLYERTVNATDALRHFRIVLLASFSKPARERSPESRTEPLVPAGMEGGAPDARGPRPADRRASDQPRIASS